MDSDRAVYGMAFPSPDANIDYYNGKNAPGSFYGGNEGVVVLFDKDKIAQNTTFTLGDSLAFKDNQTAGLMSEPKFSGAYDGWANMDLDDFNSSSLTDMFNTTSTRSAADLVPGNKAQHYLEFQIHGADAHSIDNIKEVVFSKGCNNQGLLDQLTQLGIKYTIIP